MKQSYLFIVSVIVFSTITLSLKSQDFPNGSGIGTGPVVHDEKTWNTNGNTLSLVSGNVLGSINEYPVRICTNNLDRIYIDASGKVGINTTVPLQKLHIIDGNILISRSPQTKGSSELGSTNGTLYFGDVVSASQPYGKWGIEYVSSVEDGYGLNFWKPAVSGQMFGNYFLFLSDSGNVGIGTKNPQAKLAVNGDLLAKEIRVSIASTDWPDYVFSDDYNKISLDELELYIKENGHLPGVPSAQEIDEVGSVNLGEMNVILLQKIEEMTLKLIEMEKLIDFLMKQHEFFKND